MLKKQFLKFIFGLIFCGCLLSEAMMELEITEGISRPWALSFSSPEDPVQRGIMAILKRSGRCYVIEENQSLEVADFHLTVETKLIGGEWRASLRMQNIQKQVVWQRFFKAYSEDQLVYQISDAVFHKLTGIPGVFATKIAYVFVDKKTKVPTYYLRIVDVNGKKQQDLLVSQAPIMSPAWAPDGKSLAYVSFENHRAAIYIHNLKGKRELVTYFPGINGAPAWSPDGKQLVVVLTNTGYPKLYIYHLKNKRLQQLTENWYIDTEPNFSPDGKFLVFTSNRGGTPQLYLLNLRTYRIKRLTFSGKYNARGLFTPDGKSLIMLHGRDGLFCIAKQDLETGTLIPLTVPGRYESPSLSPNGEMVVYAEGGQLRIIVLAGEVIYGLPVANGEIREPVWSPYLSGGN